MSDNIIAFRLKLANVISTLDNKSLLLEISKLIDQNNSLGNYALNADQISAVEEARTQIYNGDSKDAETIDNEILEWLEK